MIQAVRPPPRRQGGAAFREVIARNANRNAADLALVPDDLRERGVISFKGIAAALNERGILTRRGGRRPVSTVCNLVTGLAAAQ